MHATKEIKQSSRFHIGDGVHFTIGTRHIKGIIVEDRGAIGYGGRYLYRIVSAKDKEHPEYFEVPADRLNLNGHQST